MLNVGSPRKRVVLMQPYLLPYLGYYQLLGAADLFVSYDTAQFIKNGWIERNRYLLNGEPRWFSVALEKSSHTAPILRKRISKVFDVRGILNKLANAYRKAPNAPFVLSWLQPLLEEPASSIAELNVRMLKASCDLIGVTTPIISASELGDGVGLSGQARVLELMTAVGASHYLNPSAGAFLYDSDTFSAAGMQLQLLQARLPSYQQGSHEFLPGLSILDALMFNPAHTVGEWARQGIVKNA
ncbi:WbqC family protein [uncultured Pseudomonas sp.]|uniref:WbqC family protein n=1 Tax=uncultured Pseudomonas sp. TaxID=114707 RepID=UPI0025DFC305|nr:WbqC family protein [uncultured Pseudomonas sp.]